MSGRPSDDRDGSRAPRGLVDRCVCRCVPLSATLRLRESEPDITAEGAMERLGMGDRCGMCIPYIRAALETGRSEFSPGEPAVRRAGRG